MKIIQSAKNADPQDVVMSRCIRALDNFVLSLHRAAVWADQSLSREAHHTNTKARCKTVSWWRDGPFEMLYDGGKYR